MSARVFSLFLTCCALVTICQQSSADSQGYTVRQITFGPKHHFFGYIGHVGNIPWNASGRYILALRVGFQDRLPDANDPAEIVLLDTQDNYSAKKVDQTLAWNPQQGTMFYWNPQAPETQFFFNDRDPETGKLFTVLFDITSGKRVREYRFSDTPVANSGVAQKGGYFLAINYGRMARLRPVTGYVGAWDWTLGVNAPKDDGIFKINIKTGKKELLVSFARLRDEIRSSAPHVDNAALFINHTLWNRDDDRVYFYARGNFRSKLPKVDVPFTIDMDGTLQIHQHVGGHPEWEQGHRMIGDANGEQIIYDTDTKKIVGKLGQTDSFPDPGGDIALSPNGKQFVNGYGNKRPGENFYAILLREEGRLIRTNAFSRGSWVSGALRLDPAPCWNRTGTQIVVPAISDDAQQSRQMFVISLE